MPTDANGNIIATQICQTITTSTSPTSTTICYKSLDVWYMFFIDFIIVLIVVILVGKFIYALIRKD